MILPPILIAAWFSNPIMLWGMAAASIPILIHLLNRRKYREVPWAAMRFLLAAVKKNQRRVRIEQWLLLLIRTLLIACAVLAMAKPILESLGAMALLPGQRTHWVLALDGTLSMTREGAEATRFDQARALASQLARSARAGDAFSVVLLADPPRAVIGAPAFAKDAVIEALAELQPTHSGLDVAAGFAKIEEVLAASDIPRKELMVLTDMQATSWARPGASPSEDLKRLAARLTARSVRSTVLDLGASGDANHAVVDLRIDPPLVTSGATATVQATVRRFGPVEGAGTTRARLIVDGAVAGEQPVELLDSEPRTVAFAQPFRKDGEHIVEVQLDPDPLKPDDARRLVVPVREAVRVLLVDGDPSPEPLRSETSFLAEALAPEPGPGEPASPVRVDAIAESQLVGRDLDPYDAVVLANIARLTRTEVGAIEAYLTRGGGLVVFGGDQVVPDSYNQLLYRDGAGPLPARIGAPAGDPRGQQAPFEFDPLGFRHPIIEAYRGEASAVTASLTNVKTARYLRLKVPPAGTSAKVALAFTGGDPAVVEGSWKRGHVVLVATTADPGWTSWPLHQSYPPVMEQIVLLAASGRSAERTVRVGQPLVPMFPSSAIDATATVRRPTGPPVPSRVTADGDVARVRFDGTDLAGVYRIDVGPPVGRELAFAANPDPVESNPARLDAAGLRAAVPGWDFRYDDNWRPLRSNAASVGHRGELHRPLLWTVLGLLFLESFLAWRFGHHASSRR
jgi:hypothetical protein